MQSPKILNGGNPWLDSGQIEGVKRVTYTPFESVLLRTSVVRGFENGLSFAVGVRWGLFLPKFINNFICIHFCL